MAVWSYVNQVRFVAILGLFQALLLSNSAFSRDMYQSCLKQRAEASKAGIFDENSYIHHAWSKCEPFRAKRCCICVTSKSFQSDTLCKDLKDSGCQAYAELPWGGGYSEPAYPDGSDFNCCSNLEVQYYTHNSPSGGTLIRQAVAMACTYGAITTKVRHYGCETFGDRKEIERFLSVPSDNRALLISDQKVTVTGNETIVLADRSLGGKKGIAMATQSPLSVQLTQKESTLILHSCADFGTECANMGARGQCQENGKPAELLCCNAGWYLNGDRYFEWTRENHCTLP